MPTEKSLFRFQLNLTRLKKLQNCFQREEEHILADCVLISILGASEYPQWKEQLFSMFKVNYLLKLLSNSEMSFITRKDLLLLNSKYRRQNFQISLWKQNCKWDAPHITYNHSCRYSLTLSLSAPSLSNPQRAPLPEVRDHGKSNVKSHTLFVFYLEDNCFTMLCQFPLYHIVNQL